MNNTFKLGKNHRGIKERASKSIQRSMNLNEYVLTIE